MVDQEIKSEDYTIHYSPETQTIFFKGELSLGDPPDYAPINDLLHDVASQVPPTLTLDLTQLEFLNSSGISMISRYIISLRKQPSIQVVVLGSTDIPWQGKSLKNLKKLMPSLQLDLV